MTALKQKYEQMKEDFINDFSGGCWDSNCNGKMERLEKEEVYKGDNGCWYIRVTKCNVCGKSSSTWTFVQWLKNRKDSAKTTIREAKKEKKELKEVYKYNLARLKKEFAKGIEEINAKVKWAKEDLQELANRSTI